MGLKDSKGFSLIEMMTVVAIIAALTLVAYPSYKTFQAKARQKEGLNLLSGYFSLAIATRTDFGLFPGNLVGTGYAPAGQLTYRMLVDDNPNPLPGETAFNNDDACISTDQACDCGGNCASFRSWNELPVGAAGGPIGPTDPGAGGPCPTLGAIATTDDAFVAGVAGFISTSAALADTYYVNETKTIEMCQDGLK